MTDMHDPRLDTYYREAESWAQDRQRATDRSVRIAWIVAGIAIFIAAIEAIALILLIPLKRDVPYTLLVDKETGFVQALKPLDADTMTADAALTRSFLVQYVIARESFDIDNLQADYRKVGLWSGGEARDRYVALMRSGNPQSPLASLPRQTIVSVEIRSVSSLSPKTAMVRFSTRRTDPGGQVQAPQNWAAILSFQFAKSDMTAEDRLTNPLGFQVIRYRKDPETLSDGSQTPNPAPSSTPPLVAGPGTELPPR